MKLPAVLFLPLLFTLFSCSKKQVNNPRRILDFNKNWQFTNQEGITFETISKASNTWQTLSVPHDWTAKTPYSQAYKVTDSTPALGGVGWYKKQFKLKPLDKDQHISIEFDGIYNNSKVWINGHYLGFWPYGYTAFSYDLTKYLKFDRSSNEIIVRVDRINFLDTRWYSGSGIYRDVNLVFKNKIHIPKWGIKIETPKISSEEVEIDVNFQTVNTKGSYSSIRATHTIIDKQGYEVVSKETRYEQKDSLKRKKTSLNLQQPELWSPKTPNLYLLNTKIYADGVLSDEANTTFGVRYFSFDADKGFFLNEEKTYIKGVCLHHAAGALGSAVPDDVWLYRLKKLKKAGVNAIRTAHNPASEVFLNLCDSLGFLVQEEIFDELDYSKDKRKNYNSDTDKEKYVQGYTNYFQEYWDKDLKSMLNRDKNHPSIFMWSIGNEIEWTYPRYSRSSGYQNSGKKYYYDEPPITISEMKERFANDLPKKYELAKTISKLSKFTKTIDTTRPVTANLVIPTISHISGYTDALDVIGYSYRACLYNYGHRNYPEKMIYGSENWANYVEWKSVLDNPHVPGVFLWTGINYMGETRNLKSRGSASGLINYSGDPTPRWYMFKSVWNEEPMIYATTYPLKDSDYTLKNNKVIYKTKDLWKKRRWSWQAYNYHWNYTEKETIVVEVFTNCPEVKLLLNDSEIGVEKLTDYEDHLIKFAVPYETGELKVIGNCDQEDVDYTINTTGTVAKLQLTANTVEIESGSNTTIFIKAQLVDENNNPITHMEREISFEIESDLEFLAIENDDSFIETVSSIPKIQTFKGTALLYLKGGKNKGVKKVTAILPNGTSKAVSLVIN